MTIRSDIQLKRGDTDSITVTFDNTDLTGATIFFTAKPTISNGIDDSDAVIDITVTDFSPLGNDPENGTVVIPIAPADTNTVTPGDYFYDIQAKLADGTITSIPVHKLTIVADITRRTS